MYPDYIFDIVSILIGVTGLVTKVLLMNLKKTGVKNTKQTCKRCQEKTLLGSLKTAKDARAIQRLPRKHIKRTNFEFQIIQIIRNYTELIFQH